MRRGDGAAERLGQRLIDLAGEMVERAILIKAPHLDQPVDRYACAVDRKLSVRPARNRLHANVNFRRERRVDGKLGRAGLLALRKRRIVEKGKAHGTFDLERAGAGKKH
jgi:hypothetical protein